MRDLDQVNDLIAGGVGVVVNAVQEEAVIGAAHAVDVECALARRNRVSVDGPVDVGGQQRQVGIIASIQRQIDDLLGVHHLPMFARIGIESRGRSRDLDGLCYRTHLQGGIDTLASVDINPHIFGRELLKPGFFYRQAVAAHLYIEEIVVAAGVRGALGLDTRLQIRQRYSGAGNNCARGVADRAQDLRGFELAISQSS